MHLPQPHINLMVTTVYSPAGNVLANVAVLRYSPKMRHLILLAAFFGSVALAQTSPPPPNQPDATPPPKAKHVYTEEDMEKYHPGGSATLPAATSLSGERLSQVCDKLVHDPKVQQQASAEEFSALSRDCPRAVRELVTDPRVVDVVETLREEQDKICTLRREQADAAGKAQQAHQNTASINQSYSGQIASVQRNGAYQRKAESVMLSMAAEIRELRRQTVLNANPNPEAKERLGIASLKGIFFVGLAANHFYISPDCVASAAQKLPQ